MSEGDDARETMGAFIERMREWRHRGKPLPAWTREDYESYFHEVMRPGVVLTAEMVFILGIYTGAHGGVIS